MNEAEAQGLVDGIARRAFWRAWLANGIGFTVVFIAIGFLVTVFFNQAESDELGRKNLPFAVVGTLVGGAVLMRVFLRRLRATLAWVVELREPTDDEHRRTLKTPAFAALLTALGWGLAALSAGLYNLDHSIGAAALIATSLWLGGETTSALAYLISERTMRPAVALALAVREPERSFALGVRNRLLFAWSLGTAVPLMSVLVVGIVGLTDDSVEADAVAAACVFLGAVALAVGLLATVITARAIAGPLTAMRGAVERVAAGRLDVRLPIDDASEVGQLQAGFNRMADGLREREHIRDLFGRQVGHDVARAALREGTRLGGEEREIGALFVDVEGSTSMALAMPPTEVVRVLNRFFRVVIEVVEDEGGFVNKFEGDAALCVFGAPIASEDPAGQALCAARALAARLERELPEIGFGIGVSAGRAVAGNIGSEQRFEYTVIGDPVNEAARLCDVAKERQVRVVASDAALRRATEEERSAWAEGERTVLRGRLEATVLASPRA